LDLNISLLVKEMIDEVTEKASDPLYDNTAFYENAKIILLLLIIYFPGLIFLNWVKSLFIKKALVRMKSDYVKKVFQKNINEFQKDNNSTYLSALTNDYDQIETNYLEPVIDIISSIINFTAGAIMFCLVNPYILIIALGLMLLNLIISVLSSRPLNRHNKERSNLLGNYTSYIKEVLSAFHIIKTNDLETKVRHDFYDKSEKVQYKGYVIDKIQSFIFAIENATITFTFAGLLIVVGYMYIEEMVTFGGVVLIVQSVDKIIWPITGFSEALPKLFSVRSLFTKIDQSLKNKNEHKETLDFDGFHHVLELHNVSFAYEENTVLEDVNMTLEKGGKYLIIGPSGGGKSTVLKLLRKYFNPTEGSITIDGNSLNDIRKEPYFSHIANIEQNVFLFEDTLRNNLTLYKPYTDEEITEAISRAGLSDFVSQLPKGLDTMIYDNGKNISGGERSRIAIARGLLNKADIVFLDEAFANLDTSNVTAIEKSILDLKEVTVINVSHVIIKEHLPSYDKVYVIKNKTATLYPN
jgi:ATP-binding cassette subfamily C protein